MTAGSWLPCRYQFGLVGQKVNKLKVNLMLGAFPMNIFEQIIGEIVVRLVLGIIELLKDTA